MKNATSLLNGRAVIPASLRSELALQDGDQLIWQVRNGELVATTLRAKLRKAQALFQTLVPSGSPSAADELMAERRMESQGPRHQADLT